MVDATPDSVFRLEGRVALITGGTRGIGAAIAHDFAAAGASVILTGRDALRAEEAAAAIRASGAEAIGIGYNAGSMDSLRALVARITAEIGRLDILVNNAALLKPHFIEKLDVAEFDELFAVNVRAALFLTQALQPLLLQSKAAAIINLTAAGGHVPMVGIGAYCATKAALINLTHTLAKEWTSKGIRVNALTPGSVATDMILPKDAARRERFAAEMAAHNLMNRLAEPQEIARAARFLASEAASFITGQTLIVDGGYLA
jgi:NAD(P)-dependent dehydrogenase (short-subunit alcohol dehydrogenase family)